MSQGAKDIKDFAAQARTMSGAELVPLIKEVLSVKHLFSFGELLLVPQVMQLRDSEHGIAYRTLDLFAYGTLRDYTSSPATTFLDLSESEQLPRLKLLTLVSLAYQQKRLTYSTLHKELDTASARELEDLVIEAVYHGLLTAKIDQKNEVIRISSCTSRDITTKDVDAMVQNIHVWREKCVQLMSSIQDSSNCLATQRQAAADDSHALHAVVGDGLKEILTKDGGGGGAGSARSGSGLFGAGSSLLNRTRPKRSRGHQSVR